MALTEHHITNTVTRTLTFRVAFITFRHMRLYRRPVAFVWFLLIDKHARLYLFDIRPSSNNRTVSRYLYTLTRPSCAVRRPRQVNKQRLHPLYTAELIKRQISGLCQLDHFGVGPLILLQRFAPIFFRRRE